MLTILRTRNEYPEAYDILNNGGKVGHVEVRWCFCKAWLGDREIYSAHNRDYWSGFNRHMERQLHLDKIKRAAQALLSRQESGWSR